MGWFSRKKADKPASKDGRKNDKPETLPTRGEEVPGMNGALEGRRPDAVTVFEFGSVAASGDKITLAGYCPVSDDLEPCQWEILPSAGSNAPQFRVVF